MSTYLKDPSLHDELIDQGKTGYRPFSKIDDFLGPLPEGHSSWKALQKDPAKNEKLKLYFENLFKSTTPGSELAQAFLINSRNIAKKLVETKVAQSLGDVDLVLINGFYHLYAADNPWIPQEVVR